MNKLHLLIFSFLPFNRLTLYLPDFAALAWCKDTTRSKTSKTKVLTLEPIWSVSYCFERDKNNLVLVLLRVSLYRREKPKKKKGCPLWWVHVEEVVLVNFDYYYYNDNYFGNMTWVNLGWIRYGTLCDLCLKPRSLFYGENQMLLHYCSYAFYCLCPQSRAHIKLPTYISYA